MCYDRIVFFILFINVLSCHKNSDESASTTSSLTSNSSESSDFEKKLDQAFYLYQSSVEDFKKNDAYKNSTDNMSAEINMSAQYAGELIKDDVRDLINEGYFSKINKRIAEETGEAVDWSNQESTNLSLVEVEKKETVKDKHSNLAIGLVVMGSLGVIAYAASGPAIKRIEKVVEAGAKKGELGALKKSELTETLKSLKNDKNIIMKMTQKLHALNAVAFITVGAIVLSESNVLDDDQKTTALQAVLIASGALNVTEAAASGFGAKRVALATSQKKIWEEGVAKMGDKLKTLGKETTEATKLEGDIAKAKARIKSLEGDIKLQRPVAILSAVLGVGAITWGATLGLTDETTPYEKLIEGVGSAFGQFLALEQSIKAP